MLGSGETRAQQVGGIEIEVAEGKNKFCQANESVKGENWLGLCSSKVEPYHLPDVDDDV